MLKQQPNENNYRLQPNIEQSQHYLQLLAPAETRFLFAAFDDDQDRQSSPVILFGTLKQYFEKLRELNEKGYGIFVLVNRTESKQRTGRDITAYRGVWIENDSGEDSNTPVSANFIVESSPGKYHEYYLAQEMDYFQRIALQEKLVKDHHSDPNAADASRVLRLPGFYHQKKSKTKGLSGRPHMVNIISESTERAVKAPKLLAAFDLPNLLPGLVNESEKVAAEYSHLVSELLSARGVIENPEKYSSVNQNIYEQVKMVLKYISIGKDEYHMPISSELVQKVVDALDSVHGGQLESALQTEALSCLDKIGKLHEEFNPKQKLRIIDTDTDELRYVYPESEITNIRVALSCIDSDDRETWINVGYALKNHLGQNGLELWDDWSKGSYKYKPNEIQKKWEGFKPGNKINIGTVFYLAQEQLKYRVELDVKTDVLTVTTRDQWLDTIISKLNLQDNEPLKQYLIKQVNIALRVLSFGLTPATELTRQPYKPNWLVNGIMERGALIHIFGKPASGKSFLALHLAYSIGTGKPWFGFDVTQGGVVYLAGEGRSGLSKRLKALSEYFGSEAERLFVSELPGRLIDENNVSEIAESIKVICPDVKLVIVDTLHRNMGPGDENSAEDFATILSNLNQIMAINNTSVILVHHSGHNDSNRGRGSSAITAAMDMEYSVKKLGGNVTMTCTKSKDHEEPEPMIFKMVETETGWFDDEISPITSVVLERIDPDDILVVDKLKDKDKRVLSALTRAHVKSGISTPQYIVDALTDRGYIKGQIPDIVVHLDEWKKLVYPELDVNAESKNPEEAKRKSFQRVRDKLREWYRVDMSGDYWWEVQH